jgi:hypothetical protein
MGYFSLRDNGSLLVDRGTSRGSRKTQLSIGRAEISTVRIGGRTVNAAPEGLPLHRLIFRRKPLIVHSPVESPRSRSESAALNPRAPAEPNRKQQPSANSSNIAVGKSILEAL